MHVHVYTLTSYTGYLMHMIVHTCSYIYGCARQCVCVCVCVIYMLYGFYSALSVGIQLHMEEVIGTLTMIQATQQLMDNEQKQTHKPTFTTHLLH